jgi:FtsH-binding integral membrane protein
VLLGVGCFWAAFLVAAALEPGYTHRRDYVSTLAARGAEHAGLAMFAIIAAAASMLFAGLLVQRVSRLAAVAIGLAGVGFVAAAFTRLACPDGAAGCGLGGRFEISGSTEIGHWTATTVASILLIAGIALTGIALIRRGRRIAGAVSLAAAAVTAGAFLATGGENPGVMQRVGIVAGTGWLAAFALATLVRRA